ncbi:hypothetical protein [Halpernia frigidisoli]|uniref:6-phosphogluconate dehydrogenase n=1 Tax=Halpernia frigidisoli TaxID=1125876 RepID=A0A1I3F686_9FLAO|nr:hypothetical protein [Halpernia frigidisoli]SFI06660.1 hypothetical protein SAMN05443292_1177 [Halpernia frigidisoli]
MEQEIYTEKKSSSRKFFLWIILVILLFGGVFIWYKYFFVFGEGVKSGQLNFVVKKGNVFKTYEGKLIQQGFGNNSKSGALTSYEFEFSIEDKAVFDQLEANSGKNFDLHYKEYHGTIPWRGNTVYVVDRVLNSK